MLVEPTKESQHSWCCYSLEPIYMVRHVCWSKSSFCILPKPFLVSYWYQTVQFHDNTITEHKIQSWVKSHSMLKSQGMWISGLLFRKISLCAFCYLFCTPTPSSPFQNQLSVVGTSVLWYCDFTSVFREVLVIWNKTDMLVLKFNYNKNKKMKKKSKKQ